MTEQDELLRAKLNLETGRIAWRDLQLFFAAGKTLHVASDLSLVDVAFAVANDVLVDVEGWRRSGRLAPVSDAQAREWFAAEAELWSVVVRPWVLVQPVAD